MHMNETTLHYHDDIDEPKPNMVRVWDPLVRLFHWSLAASFTIAFVTEDDLLALHVWAGYLISGLILIRVLWGFVGPRHARWSDFVKEPAEIVAYLKAAVRSRAARYLGHNPAGGVMVVALMLSLTVTSLTGLAVYGAQELSGPTMAPLLSGLSEGWAHALEDIHEVLANLTLLLVLLHVAGVAFASLEHRENLVRAMITGLKRSETE
jgi:cytochrome b